MKRCIERIPRFGVAFSFPFSLGLGLLLLFPYLLVEGVSFDRLMVKRGEVWGSGWLILEVKISFHQFWSKGVSGNRVWMYALVGWKERGTMVVSDGISERVAGRTVKGEGWDVMLEDVF